MHSLLPGGIIEVFDGRLTQLKDDPLSVAEYSCLLMHSTEGKCYSTAEIADIVTFAGFSHIEFVCVVAARTLIIEKKD